MSVINTAVRLEPIPADECVHLLRTRRVGRIAVVVDGRPKIFPVNYIVDGDGTIVFRTGPGSKLRSAPMQWVAFEVDHLDDASCTGWSVVVEGVGQDITHAIDHGSVARRRLDLEPWAPGAKGFWLEIGRGAVTGRRLIAA